MEIVVDKPSSPYADDSTVGGSLDHIMRAVGGELDRLNRDQTSTTECLARIAVLVKAGIELIELARRRQAT